LPKKLLFNWEVKKYVRNIKGREWFNHRRDNSGPIKPGARKRWEENPGEGERVTFPAIGDLRERSPVQRPHPPWVVGRGPTTLVQQEVTAMGKKTSKLEGLRGENKKQRGKDSTDLTEKKTKGVKLYLGGKAQTEMDSKNLKTMEPESSHWGNSKGGLGDPRESKPRRRESL